MHPLDSLSTLKGIGQKSSEALTHLDLFTIGDLLTYYPRSYDSYKRPVYISEVREGYVCSVECTVTSNLRIIRKGSLSIITLTVNDGSGSLNLSWFNQPYLSKTIKPGSRYIFRGMVTKRHNQLCIQQPQIFTRDKYILKMREMQPVYKLCAGVTNNLLIKSVTQARECINEYKDYLSPKSRTALNLTSLSDAMDQVHFPMTEERLSQAKERLIFDEFFSFIAMGRLAAARTSQTPNAYRISDYTACEDLIASLGFELTKSQLKTFEDIKADLSSEYCSSRMVQGDVGCGKTIIALLAIVAAVAAGYKGCIMAPTEVLARQHYDEFCLRTRKLGYHVVLLTGKMTAAEKRAALEDIESGYADIIVGTHALITEKVSFKDLAVAVIDEQHRFGVKQRDLLSQKGINPYILVMSATPIPRSLAIIMYGDLRLSVIDELPKNRIPIKNCVIDSQRRATAYKFIKDEVSKGRQAYVICPMIEESEDMDAENVIDYAEELRAVYSGDNIVIEVLHGKLKKDDKNKILDDFYAGKIHVLVSTTVVEVGVNVPNATVMMIENSERFGLAQLHQLRGRVGRGSHQSYCIFIKGYSSPSIDERLNLLVKYNDGMTIAQKDLELRGPGELYGLRQSGELSFGLGDIISDSHILQRATEYVNSLSAEDIGQIFDNHPLYFKTVNSYADVL